MSNSNSKEYDGSTSTRVFVSKIKSTESADASLKRIKTRFEVLENERSDTQAQLANATDSETRVKLMEADMEMVKEQKKLVVWKQELEAIRQKLFDAKAAMVDNYKPEEINW